MIGSIIVFIIIIFLLLVLYKPESSRQKFLLNSETIADVSWKREAKLDDEIFYIDFDTLNENDGSVDSAQDLNTYDVEGFKNKNQIYQGGCQGCNIKNHPDFHKYILKSSIPVYLDIGQQKINKMQIKPISMNKNAGSSEEELPKLPKYHNMIPSLFKLNDEQDEKTYNMILKANIKDPRIRIALENKFYEAKQLEYNLSNNISKL
jgi:hypothetical protein